MRPTNARATRRRIYEPVTYDRDDRREAAALMADVARVIRAAKPAGMTDAESVFLSQIGDPGRYNFGPMLRLMKLSARCTDDAAAYALPARLEVTQMARRPQMALPLPDAVERETEEQARQDVAQMRAAVSRCPSAAQTALEACHRYMQSVKSLMHSLAVVAGAREGR